MLLVVLTLLLISGCQVPKTGRGAYATPSATATSSPSPTDINPYRNLKEPLLRSGPIGPADKYIGVDVANSQGVAPLAIKGYCGDQLIDGREQCDFYGDGTPMLGGDDCTTIKYQGRTFTSGVLSCYPPGSSNECKLDVSGCY